MKKLILITCMTTLLAAIPAQATELTDAIDNGNQPKAESLIKNGADVNTKDYLGFTPLHIAAYRGDVKIIKLLLAKGADIKSKDTANTSGPLFQAVTVKNDKNVAAAQLLIDAGADINEKNIGGYTPLHTAASDGSIEIVKILVAKGVNINAKANNGDTPLSMASRNGQKKVVTYLKSKGAK